jgi:hypothetical protein
MEIEVAYKLLAIILTALEITQTICNLRRDKKIAKNATEIDKLKRVVNSREQV